VLNNKRQHNFLYCKVKFLKKIKSMKKTLAILALALFIGGMSAPVIASNNNAVTTISLNEDDPKKTKAEKKAAKKAKKSGDAAKSEDCSGEKKSDCSSKCGGESK
jgi:hypothetical protein